jgi:gluconolactonase
MPIEQFSPKLDRIVSPDQDVELLGEGYGTVGDPFKGAGPAEGPLWWKEGGYLLFNDIGHNRMMRWAAGEGVTLFREPTNHANGVTRDLQGRLIVCEHVGRRVTRQEPDGSITVVANRYQDRPLNRPNDVIVKSDGSIYFTDPGAPAPGLDLDFSGVYRVSADLGTVTLLMRDFVVPNGLAFSPDESVFYVDDTSRGHIRAFDMRDNGMPAIGTDRVLCELKGTGAGLPDGMKLDVEGNIYCTGPGGVWVFEPSGAHLGTILIGEERKATNVAWGGEDWRTLFITSWSELTCIRLKIPGVPVPAQVS